MHSVRQAIQELNPTQLGRLVTAMANLQALDGGQVWLNIAGLHGGFSGQHKGVAPRVLQGLSSDQPWWCSHGIVTFAVWHRLYMLLFEKWLQKCDPDPTNPTPLTLPFWDNAGQPYSPYSNQTLPQQLTSATIVDFYGNVIDNPLFNGMSRYPPKPTVRRYNPAYLSQIQRAYNNALGLEQYTDFCQYGATDEGLESPHDWGHVAVGGDMRSQGLAAFDPIFYMHHCNIERYHMYWQNNNKTVISGDDASEPLQPFYPVDHPNFLQPWQNQDLVCPKMVDLIDAQVFNYTYSYWPSTSSVSNFSVSKRSRNLRIIDLPHPPDSIGVEVFVNFPNGEKASAGTLAWFTSDQSLGQCEACAKTPFRTFTLDITDLLSSYNVFFGDEDKLGVTLEIRTSEGKLISLPYKFSFDWAQDLPPLILGKLLKANKNPRYKLLDGLREYLARQGFAAEGEELDATLGKLRSFAEKAGLVVPQAEAKGEVKDEGVDIRKLVHSFRVAPPRLREDAKALILKKAEPIIIYIGDVAVELFKYQKKDIEDAILKGASAWGAQAVLVKKKEEANVIVEWVDENDAGPAGTLVNVDYSNNKWGLKFDKKVHWTLDPKVSPGFRVDTAVSQALGSTFGLKLSTEKDSLMNPLSLFTPTYSAPSTADLALL